MRELADRAVAIREKAYAPYSGYKVGAAVLDSDGNIWVGTNVENISYGLTICAERSAMSAMVAGGGKHIRAVAVATHDGGSPCGACLQCLYEFHEAGEGLTIVCVDAKGSINMRDLSEFLPFVFESEQVNRTV
mgnify:CR=1 FL=1